MECGELTYQLVAHTYQAHLSCE